MQLVVNRFIVSEQQPRLLYLAPAHQARGSPRHAPRVSATQGLRLALGLSLHLWFYT